MHDESQSNGLGAPLMPKQMTTTGSLAGMLMVTSAALLFGIVAAFVKATALPTLVMCQIRSTLEWFLVIGVALLYVRKRGMLPPVPQPEITLHSEDFADPGSTLPGGRPPPAVPPTPELREVMEAQDVPAASKRMATDEFVELLVGTRSQRGWLVLRALLYWGFLSCWWSALASMPIGDATTIVYTGPVWTATFAFLILGEHIDWTFYPIALLDACGLLLITQPSFLFGSTSDDSNDQSYLIGASCALCSAIIAGLLPVCTRKSKECFWTAVNHTSSALSAALFTPAALLCWLALDPTASAQLQASSTALFTRGKAALLLGATVTGFAGLALQTLGYQREEAAKASIMTVLESTLAGPQSPLL